MNRPAARAGWKAYAALVANGGRLDVPAGFESGAWRLAGAEPVWLGRGSRPPHPRAVCLGTAARPEGIDLGRLAACEPEPGPPSGLAREALAPCALALAGRLPALGVPKGLAALLAGRVPPFPFAAAVAPVDALAAAAGHDDPDAAFGPAHALLGLGPGLTPSGDDLVGALLFARRMLRDAQSWEATAARLVESARTRTHAISAALLADHVSGHGHAALHRVAAALAAGADPLPAARELAALGASSGWEMLAGLLIGLAGPAALCARYESIP